jgi:hypothetical protein
MSPGLEKAIQDSVEQLVTGGKPPRVIADAVLEAVRGGQLYVLTHPEVVPVFEKRAEMIVDAARAASE